MKAFEEKFPPHKVDQNTDLFVSGVGHIVHFSRREGWKAALDWAMAADGGNMDWDKIEKELEGI